jgi:hypothetical protein
VNTRRNLILTGIFLAISSFIMLKLAFLGPLRPFMRNDSMQETYAITFALLNLILPISISVLFKSRVAVFAGGALFGYLTSFVALMVAVVRSSGTEKFFAAASRFGWMDHILFHMAISLPLCGWLFGIAAALATNYFRKNHAKSKNT